MYIYIVCLYYEYVIKAIPKKQKQTTKNEFKTVFPKAGHAYMHMYMYVVYT